MVKTLSDSSLQFLPQTRTLSHLKFACKSCQRHSNRLYSLLARFTCNFKCDRVRVIVAWGKNCREESDKVFAIGYQVRKGTCRVLTVIKNLIVLLSVPPHLSQSTTSTDLVCRDLWPLSVFGGKGRCHGLQH